MMRLRLAAAVLSTLLTPAAWAQTPLSGNVSFTLDHFPNSPSADNLPAEAGSHMARGRTTRGATEIRVRLFADSALKRGVLTLRAAGYVEGLVADRMAGDTSSEAIVRPQELYAELAGKTVDVRAGFSRIVWGRLDELQPGDAINPLDLSKFFFEGRSEARLPVLVLRGRWHFREGGTLEGVLLPKFQPGHFDQLDEKSSPFNLVPRAICNSPTDFRPKEEAPAVTCIAPRIRIEEPTAAWRNLQGGARVTATIGRVDWAVAAFRGFEAFPLYRVEPSPIGGALYPTLVGSHPRTSMIAGDFESVLGEWGIRGEVAAFLEDNFQSADATSAIEGRSVQAGVGIDRRSGVYRFSASMLIDHTSPGSAQAGQYTDGPAKAGLHDESRRPASAKASAVRRSFSEGGSVAKAEAGLHDETDLTMIGSTERTFARETRLLRGFGLYNVSERTAFLRVVAALSVRDNLWLEGSGGLFLGEGDDVLGLFRDRDFVYVRVKYYF